MTETYLKPAEVAAVLRRSVKALYRLIESDPSFPRLRLPSSGKSGGLLIPRAGFERWQRDNTEGMRGTVRHALERS